jgi:hypothetical protein
VAECDGGVAVAAGAIAVELEIGPMFDGKNASERVPAEVRNQALGVIRRVGRIGKHEIEGCLREPLGEAQGVTPIYRNGVRYSQHGDILFQCSKGGRIEVDESRGLGPAGERLQPKRATSSVQIQYAGTLELSTQNAHPGLTYPVGGRSHAGVPGHHQPAATVLSSNDSQRREEREGAGAVFKEITNAEPA